MADERKTKKVVQAWWARLDRHKTVVQMAVWRSLMLEALSADKLGRTASLVLAANSGCWLKEVGSCSCWRPLKCSRTKLGALVERESQEELRS